MQRGRAGAGTKDAESIWWQFGWLVSGKPKGKPAFFWSLAILARTYGFLCMSTSGESERSTANQGRVWSELSRSRSVRNLREHTEVKGDSNGSPLRGLP